MADNTDNWTVVAVGTNAGASATKAAVTGKRHVVTAIMGFGDKDGTVSIESPAATLLAEWIWDISAETGAAITYPKWAYGGLAVCGAKGGAIVGKLSASTANCSITICGYTEEVY